MPRQRTVKGTWTCKHCGETHDEFYREEYSSSVRGITVCSNCECGDDTLQGLVEETVGRATC